MVFATSSMRKMPRFALTRHPEAPSDPRAKFLPRYGRATLLSFEVLRSAHGLSDSEDSHSGSSTFSGYAYAHYGLTNSESDALSDMSKWMARQNKIAMHTPSTHSSSSYETNGLAAPELVRCLLADDTPGRERLCVFVVADSSTIHDAMISALYQRCSWDIHSPLLGFITVDDSLAFRVVIGWLDDQCSPSQPPEVHVIQPIDAAFDIGTLGGGMSLAFFTLGLRKSFAADRRRALDSTPRTALLLWRADQIEAPDTSQSDRHARLEAWRLHTASVIDSPTKGHKHGHAPETGSTLRVSLSP
ncbi:hypothetical protein OF83DRAFT_1122670 [Amylostereum chailletii]|nr:hypothetical protein OF83DRAFT_1122670 [Amylostereum chailletii]